MKILLLENENTENLNIDVLLDEVKEELGLSGNTEVERMIVPEVLGSSGYHGFGMEFESINDYLDRVDVVAYIKDGVLVYASDGTIKEIEI